MGKYDNLCIGDTFGLWTVIGECHKDRFGHDSYECRCTCGTEHDVTGRALVNGMSKSCGCARRVTEDAKRERIRKYKRQYYQDHRDELVSRHAANMKRLIAEQRDKYGRDIYYLCSRYKLNIQDYLALVQAQHNRCAICNMEFNPSSRETVACVDHDHYTGKVRGLLCRQCNSALGLLHDNVELCLNAYRYLKEYEDEKTCVCSEDRMEEAD